MNMWLVTGDTGEFSDYDFWCVRIFDNEDDANEFARLANNWLIKHHAHVSNYDYNYRKGLLVCHFDSQFHTDYTGARYGVEMVMCGEIPELDKQLFNED